MDRIQQCVCSIIYKFNKTRIDTERTRLFGAWSFFANVHIDIKMCMKYVQRQQMMCTAIVQSMNNMFKVMKRYCAHS